ncbi:MAG: hypothetical protein DHS20C11_21460 [Lysobacteraceae bacterium]|nr:MAG: hypothetical protein DHS20C11_21460 [Xanthomonadaceae bacterium]
MNNKLLPLLFSAAFGSLATSAESTEAIDYTYLEIYTLSRDLVRYGDGYGVQGSYALSDHFFLTAGYARVDVFANTNFAFPGSIIPVTETDWYSLGLGAHWSVGTKTDWYVEGNFNYVNRRNGGELFTGIRGQLATKAEYSAYLGGRDVKGRTLGILGGEAVLEATEHVGFGIGMEVDDTQTLTVMMSVRFR